MYITTCYMWCSKITLLLNDPILYPRDLHITAEFIIKRGGIFEHIVSLRAVSLRVTQMCIIYYIPSSNVFIECNSTFKHIEYSTLSTYSTLHKRVSSHVPTTYILIEDTCIHEHKPHGGRI